MSTTTAQSVALAIFRALVQQVGVEMVQLVLEAVTNPETAATTLLDDLSVLAGGIVRDVALPYEYDGARRDGERADRGQNVSRLSHGWTPAADAACSEACAR